MRSKACDKANSRKVIRMNQDNRMDGYITHAKYHPDKEFEKAMERFKRPAYGGKI